MAILSQALFAEVYVEYDYGSVLTEDSSYFKGAESLSNTVGGNTNRQDLAIGLSGFKNGSRIDAFIYAWKDGIERYNETGYGLGAKWLIPVNNYVSLGFGAKGGVGGQSSNGKTFMSKSGLSNASFITGYNATSTPTLATFTRDTAVFEINLVTEMVINIYKNIDLSLQMTYLNSHYQFEYRVPSGIVSESGLSQDNLLLSAGLKYTF